MDLTKILSGLPAIGSFFKGVADVGNTVGNFLSSASDAKWNMYNYLAQKEQQRYDRQMQERMLMREDTAVQRRTADLKAAGINPILAAGQSASAGPVIHSQAPRGEGSKFPQMQTEAIPLLLSLMKQQAEIGKTKRDMDLALAKQRESEKKSEKLDQEIDLLGKENEYRAYENLTLMQSKLTRKSSSYALDLTTIANQMQGIADIIGEKLKWLRPKK